jgi:PAS domain S-box-containing protein
MDTDRRSPITPDDFHSIISTSIDGFLLVDLKGNILETNDSYCQMVGYSRDELLKLHILSIDAIDNKDDVARRFELIIQDGSLRFGTRHLRKDGFVIDVEVSANYSPSYGGSIFSFIRDVSDKKRIADALKESEWKFRALFDNSPIGVAYHRMVYDDSGKAVDYFFLDANEKYIELTGVDPRGKTVTQAFPGIENDPFDWIGTFGRVARTGVTLRIEQYLQLNDRWYDCVGYQYKPDHFVAAFLEITERKKAEESLKRSQTMLARTEKISHVGSWEWDIATDSVTWSDELFSIVQRNPADGVPSLKQQSEIYHPDDMNELIRVVRIAQSEGTPYELELRAICPNGDVRICLANGIAERGNDGKVTRLFGSLLDITERIRTEEALRESEKSYRILFDNAGDSIFINDTEGKVLAVNQQACKTLGYSQAEFMNMSVSGLDSPEQSRFVPERIARLMEQGRISFETVHQRKDGSLVPTEATVNKITWEGQSAIMSICRDITERKLTEAALKESEQRFRSLMEDIPSVAAQGYALDGTVLFWNRTSELLYGYSREEALGANLLDLIIPEEMKEGVSGAIQQMNESGEAIPAGELLLKRKDGSRVPVFSSHALLKPIDRQPEFFCLDIDLTERKCAEEQRINLEKQLLHAQKLESLGVLAGGIAHDFNNLLMAIMGNADLALMRLNKESPAVENLHRIEQASARAADLAKQMLAYSGKGKFIVESINMNILLEEMLHMLEVSISKKAVLRLNPHQHLPAVEADVTQMRQIVMNLVINASEAIGDKSGVIAITTGCMDCDRSYLKDVWLDENISEGLYVYLEIADTGCGMDKETMAKLFDPFFTTKFTGRGLGMAAVLGIVRGHKGAIKVYSELKRGTTFKILLPASSRPSEIFNGTSRHSDWKGEGAVLLVDDEETVRGIGTEMLKELGFSVITADDGREGVEQFKQNPDIRFIILDLTMPHMDGEQCFRELRQIKPDVKVIMSSGYNEQEVTQKFVGKGLAGFIQKPYKLSVLKEAVRSIA